MRKSISYLFLLVQLIPATVFAGDYKLVLGKGFEVCEAYLKNLNSFPKAPPMVCERPLNPRLKELSKPQWQPLEVWPNRHLLRQALRNKPFNLKYSDEEFEKHDPLEKWEANLRARLAERAMTFGVANLDVDRDGKEEAVLRFDSGFPCDPTNESTFANPGSGIEFYVLTPDQRGLEAWKSGNFNVAGRPEIFLYKGRVYLTTWVGNLKFTQGQLTVRTPLHVPHGMEKEIRSCKYEYKPANERRHP